jgi:hypothetical protein
MVPPPRIIGRTMAHNLRLWLRERRELRRAAKERAVTNLRSP